MTITDEERRNLCVLMFRAIPVTINRELFLAFDNDEDQSAFDQVVAVARKNRCFADIASFAFVQA